MGKTTSYNNKSGLGSQLNKATKLKNRPVTGSKNASRHVADLNPAVAKLDSVIERTDLEEFLTGALMAQREFAAVRGEVVVVDHAANVVVVEKKESIAGPEDDLHEYETVRIPRRPNWKGLTPDELDQLETDNFLEWRRELAEIEDNSDLAMTPFEKNLEVWRQLWRVVERSDIVIMIVDARNPLLFRSGDLESWVAELGKQFLLVVNKSDLLSEHMRHAWEKHLDGENVIFISATDGDVEGVLDRVKEMAFHGKTPSVDQQVTVGCVGYPNVGKSSLINALCGEKKVGVASMPGKTRHFQTLKLADGITLCDCPGLVFPQFMNSKAALVCNGILPIDRLRDWDAPIRWVCARVSRKQLEDVMKCKLRSTEPIHVMRTIALARGHLSGGSGNPDEARAARNILKAFTTGKLLFCNPPPNLTEVQREAFINSLPQTFIDETYEEVIEEVVKDQVLDSIVNPDPKEVLSKTAFNKLSRREKARLRKRGLLERKHRKTLEVTGYSDNQYTWSMTVEGKNFDGWDEVYCIDKFSPRVESVRMFRHCQTGLRVMHAKVPGPLVHGYFALATEAHSDDGCPHTLEHLVFLGSKKYPYKGVLDELANRNFSQGTNAWTDTDHTCYTISTVGSDGFKNLLPVYLDHILYPTLTDEGFVTEVHHVTGAGHDGGVVYCEMQGRENTSRSRTNLALLRAVYPEGCAYRSETGGLLKELRSLDVDTVRAYHREFYHPQNLCIVVVGNITYEAVFDSVKDYLPELPVASTAYTRPFGNPVSPLTSSSTTTVMFPSEDETTGLVYIGWRGPKWTNFTSCEALDILFTYLCDTTLAPLQKAFVECPDPICTNVDASVLPFSETLIALEFSDVVSHSIRTISGKFFDIVKKLADGTIPLDMKRMKSILRMKIRETLSTLEVSPEDSLVSISIEQMLYGDIENPDEIAAVYGEIARLEALIACSSDYWTHILTEYLLTPHHVVILGVPSKVFAEESAEQERLRVEQQIADLGVSRLAGLEALLSQSEEQNHMEVPETLIDMFPIPPVKIDLIPLQTYRAHSFNPMHYSIVKPLEEGISNFLQIDDVPSSFVQLRALFDTSCIVTSTLRPYLCLFCELLFESPMLVLGKVIPVETVVQQLEDFTVSYGAGLGLSCGQFTPSEFGQLFTVAIIVLAKDYAKGIEWLNRALTCIVLDVERVRICATRMSGELVGLKREGSAVMRAASALQDFSPETSTRASSSIFIQDSFLQSVLSALDTDPERIIADLSKLREEILEGGGRFHCVLNRSLQSDLLGPWMSFDVPSKSILTSGLTLSRDLYVPGNEKLIISISGLESSYMFRTCPCPVRYGDPEFAAVSLVLEYLTTLEGPFWKGIRGAGLAYGYGLRLDPFTGLLAFSLYRASDVFAAYIEAKAIVIELSNAAEGFDEDEVDAAKSSYVYEVVSSAPDPMSSGKESIRNYLAQVSPNYGAELVETIGTVTSEQMQNVFEKYVVPIFSSSSRVVISSPPSLSSELAGKFAEKGETFTLQTVEELSEKY